MAEYSPSGVGSDFLSYLRSPEFSVLATPQAPDISAGARLLGHVASTPAYIADDVSRALGNVTGNEEMKRGLITPDMEMAPAQTGWQGAADVVGRGLLPMAAEISLMSPATRGLTSAMGLAETGTAAKVVTDAAQFGALGLRDDKTTALEQVGEGAGIGLSSILRRGPRALALAGLALGSKAYFDSHADAGGAPPEVVGKFLGHDWTRGDISAVGLFAAGMFHGNPALPEVARGPLPDHFTPAPETTPAYPTTSPGTIDSRLHPRWAGEKPAEESARAMQAAWGFDPEAQGSPDLFGDIAADPMSSAPKSPTTIAPAVGDSLVAPAHPDLSMQIHSINEDGHYVIDSTHGLATISPEELQGHFQSGELQHVPTQTRSAAESASVLQSLQNERAQRASQNYVPPVNNPPSVEQLLGLAGPTTATSAEDAAKIMMAQHVAQEQAMRFQQFKDNRVIPARWSGSPELGTITHDVGGESVLPPQNGPRAIVKAGYDVKQLFNPEDAQWLKDTFNADISYPEIQDALLKLKLGVSQAMVRSDRQLAQIAFVRFVEEISHRPDVNAFNPQIGEEAWNDIVKRAEGARLNEAPLVSHPLAEGDPVGLGTPPKSKIPDIPNSKTTQGGFADADVLQKLGFGAGRAALGGYIGGNLPGDDPNDHTTRGIHSAVGAAIFAGLPYAGRLVPILQRMEERMGGARTGFNEAGSIPAGAKGKVVETATSRDIKPVIRLPDGTIISHPEARSHANLSGDPRVEALGPDYNGIEFGFVAKDKWIPRERLPELVGSDEAVGSIGLKEGLEKGSLSNRTFDISKFDSLQSLQKGMNKATTEGGYIMPELKSALTRGVVGAVIGGAIGGATDDPNDHSGFLTGAIIGTAAAMSGPAIGRSIARMMATGKVIPPLSPKEGYAGLVRNWGARMQEAAGLTFHGSQSITARLFRTLDQGLGITMPPNVVAVLNEAKGQASVYLDQIDTALKQVSVWFRPSEEVQKLTNQYLDGKIKQDGYLQALQNHIELDPNVENYSKYVTTARESMNGLQRMIAEGVGDEATRKKIISSLDTYLTRSFKIFVDSRWNPDEQSTLKLATELSKLTRTDSKGITTPLMGTTSVGDIISGLNQYSREIKQTKGLYIPSSPIGQTIEQGVLKSRIQLSAAWKEWLGEITDPNQRIQQTVSRLRPMAEASQFFERIANVNEKGRPHVFSSQKDLETFRSQTLQALQNVGAEHPDAPLLNKHLEALKNYQHVENNPRYGELRNKIVSLPVWDNLKTYDSITQIQSGWGRSIANAHTIIKLTRTAFSPITVLRNMATAPMFLAIGKGTMNDVVNAWQIMRDPSHPLRNEIFKQGIANVDQIKSELIREFENFGTSKLGFDFGSIDLANFGLGKLDASVAEAVARRGFSKVLDFYRAPDNLTRIASYLSARRRIAQELGLEMTNPKVIEMATNFTNRYTMNYDAVSPFVKKFRQIPLANLFLSYTAEMGRIGKNLIEDVIRGDMNDPSRHGRLWAMTMLSSLVVVPELIQSASENALSEGDRKDWEKAKKLMPDYSRTRYRMGITRDPKTKQFSYYDFTGFIPQDSYQQMAKAIMNQDWAALAQVNPLVGLQNTPALNIIISQTMGQDLHNMRKFRALGEGGVGDRFASIAKEVSPPFTPGIGSEAERFKLAYSTNDKGESGITNAKTGVKLTPADVWFPYFTFGLKPGSVNLGVLETRFQNQAKQDVANEIAYANDLLKTDISPEKKKQVIEKTKLVLESIRARYAAQVGATP